jgi:hypothetical protein
VQIVEVTARCRIQEALQEMISVTSAPVGSLHRAACPADPRPGVWFEAVAVEVDSGPQPASAHGDGSGNWVHEDGTHAVRRPPAEAAGDHHIESRGPADRSGETDVRHLGDLSHFDHLLSSAYLGEAHAPA